MSVLSNFLASFAILFVSILIVYICYLEFFAFKFPKNLPLVGFRNEIFGRTRASLRQLYRSPEIAAEGYRKYGQNGLPCVIPHMSCRPQVMLPQAHVKWLVGQPDTVLNAIAVRVDRAGTNYFPLDSDSETMHTATHKIILECFTKKLNAIQPQIYEGIRYAVNKALDPTTSEWQEFPLADTVETFLDTIVGGAVFGIDLSRDDGFLKALRRFLLGAGLLTEAVGQLPIGIIRPLFAYPIKLFTLVAKRSSIAYLRPRIRGRLGQIQSEQDSKTESEGSYDFLKQCLRAVNKLTDPTGISEEEFIADSLMFLALASIGSSRVTTVNILLSILGPGAKHDTWSLIQNEAESIILSESDWTDPNSLRKMTNIDSILRESGRLSPMQTRGLLKQVMPKEGIDLPDGTHIPQGTWLGVAIEAVHRDETIYPNALEFDPLRFARMKADAGTVASDFVTPSDKYLFFSYGSTMCPGRWFATRVMKLLFAYMAFHYDIKPLAECLERSSIGDTKIHLTPVKLVVRRRKVGKKVSE